MGKWICSDPDCAQYYRKDGDFTFSFIEVRECLDEYVVSHGVIDIRDYTLDGLWVFCGGYYESYEQMIADFGLREALHLMAECVFEELPFGEMEWNKAGFHNAGSAIKYIHEWINEHGSVEMRRL